MRRLPPCCSRLLFLPARLAASMWVGVVGPLRSIAVNAGSGGRRSQMLDSAGESGSEAEPAEAQSPEARLETNGAADGWTGSKKRKRTHKEMAAKVARYARGDAVQTKQIKDKKLKGNLQHVERLAAEAAVAAAKADEWLLPSEAGTLEAEGMERTWRFQQAELLQHAEEGAQHKAFDLRLDELGPYNLDMSRSGRYMLIGGRKGHLGLMDWQRGHTFCEVQVRERVRDVKFLHNEQFFAAAQRKHVYIYDKRGLEVHCLREHTDIRRLDFLPYHFLLTSIGQQGVLRYQDTSTGHIIAQHRTRLGPCDVLRHNPWNGVSLLGHANGTVTMWSPNVTVPLVKMLTHRGPVKSLAADSTGHHLVTTGADHQVTVWDLRTYRRLHSYFAHAPAQWCDVSQRGLLAVGWGRRVAVWRDALAHKQQSPYLAHTLQGGAVRDFHFCPYEDVLAVGHSNGISTLLVPGAGEPNFDSYVADPFQGRKARREQEVHQLLDKLQPDMIVLDPASIGQVRKEPKEVQLERKAQADEANRQRQKQQDERNAAKSKMKGKNRPSKRHRKKQVNIIEERKPGVRERIEQEQQRKAAKEEAARQAVPEGAPKALHRFYRPARQT